MPPPVRPSVAQVAVRSYGPGLPGPAARSAAMGVERAAFGRRGRASPVRTKAARPALSLGESRPERGGRAAAQELAAAALGQHLAVAPDNGAARQRDDRPAGDRAAFV